MKQDWLISESEEHWQLTEDEQLLLGKREQENQLGFCLMLKYFQFLGYFPSDIIDIPAQVIEYIVKYGVWVPMTILIK